MADNGCPHCGRKRDDLPHVMLQCPQHRSHRGALGRKRFEHRWIKLLLESHPAPAKSAAAKARTKRVVGTKGMKRRLTADLWVGRSVSTDADLDRVWATEKGWTTRAATAALRDSWNADGAQHGTPEIAIGDELHVHPDGSQMQLEPPGGWSRLGFFNFVDLAMAEMGAATGGRWDRLEPDRGLTVPLSHTGS